MISISNSNYTHPLIYTVDTFQEKTCNSKPCKTRHIMHNIYKWSIGSNPCRLKQRIYRKIKLKPCESRDRRSYLKTVQKRNRVKQVPCKSGDGGVCENIIKLVSDNLYFRLFLHSLRGVLNLNFAFSREH